MTRYPRRLWTPIRLSAVALAFILELASNSDVLAQAPAAAIPAVLQGKWDAASAPFGTLTVLLGPQSAVIISNDGRQLGFLAGTLDSVGERELKLLWTMEAFAGSAVREHLAKAWPAAVADPKISDPVYPGLVATSIKLHYDSSKGSIEGRFVPVTVIYDGTGKYDHGQIDDPIPISLTRHLAPRRSS